MKKQLLTIAMSLALPLASFAGTNNVTLGTSAILTVGGYNLTVSGTSATVGSVTVGASNFSVVLQPGSLIAVSSATGQVLANDAPSANVTGNQCSGGVSTLTLSSVSSSDVTVTVTPSASTCTGSATNSTSANTGGGGSPGGGGGGGGGYNFVTPAATTAKPATPSVTTTPIAVVQPTTVTPSSYTFSKPLSVGVDNSDVKKLQQVLNTDADTRIAASGAGSPGRETTYFGSATLNAVKKFQVKHGLAGPGDPGYGSVGPKTRAKLSEISKGGLSVSVTTSIPAATVSVSGSVTKSLDIGASDSQVKIVQQILNNDPDTRVSSSGVGSPGNETNYFGPATTAAVKKFQVKYGIAGPGDAGYGHVGPATRAKLNELGSGASVMAPTNPVVTPSASVTADIAQQLNDSLKLLQALQEQLKALKN